MATQASTHVHVHPAPGVTIYTGGRHGPFEPGRPVPLPADHAALLLADGLVALKPWAKHIAELEEAEKAAVSQAAAAVTQATQAEQTAAAQLATAQAAEAAAAAHTAA